MSIYFYPAQDLEDYLGRPGGIYTIAENPRERERPGTAFGSVRLPKPCSPIGQVMV